ncbi:hypothetical protein JK636_11150 [Clostridium sp. YIM B02515]|uniref:Uncharacterized protein n=1 Tax=Clostridium rhizosphaerae TaxID=2803861 RepID=A0ABS1TAE8_9CLOT|nr:hypothetical protein [Clostridium rhizosphaerae]MBL4936317.1 hypothetical protein [Clostridium rhizosphaerae]
MRSKEYMRKIYRKFSDFVSIAAARELEYFIMDSRFTSSFNYRMKKMVDEIKKEKNDDIEFSILFNTEDEIALIDANILGKYIGNNYNIKIEEYYKNAGLNKIIRDVINGSEKSQKDFITISYSVLYRTFDTIYSEIRCKKDTVDKYKRDYLLTEYDEKDIGAVIASVLILEDICRYIGIRENIVLQAVNDAVFRKNI